MGKMSGMQKRVGSTVIYMTLCCSPLISFFNSYVSDIDGAYIQALRQSKKMVLVITEDFLSESLCNNIHDYIINENRNEDLMYVQYHDIPARCWESNEYIRNIEILQKAMDNAGRGCLRLGKKLNWRDDYDSVPSDGKVVVNNKKSKNIEKFWKQLRLYLPPKDAASPPESLERRPPRPSGMV